MRSHLDSAGFDIDEHVGELHAADAVLADGILGGHHAVAVVVLAAIRAVESSVMSGFPDGSSNGSQAFAFPGTPTCPSAKTIASGCTPSTGASRVARSRAARYAAFRAAGVSEPVTRLPPDGGTGRIPRVADVTGDLVGTKPELLGHHLRQHRSCTGADILRAAEGFDRPVAVDAHLARRRRVNHRYPVRLRHAEAALERPRVRAGLPPRSPAELLGADVALHAPRARILGAAGVDPVAQRDGIHAQPLGELVERLLEARRYPAPVRAPEKRRTARRS